MPNTTKPSGERRGEGPNPTGEQRPVGGDSVVAEKETVKHHFPKYRRQSKNRCRREGDAGQGVQEEVDDKRSIRCAKFAGPEEIDSGAVLSIDPNIRCTWVRRVDGRREGGGSERGEF